MRVWLLVVSLALAALARPVVGQAGEEEQTMKSCIKLGRGEVRIKQLDTQNVPHKLGGLHLWSDQFKFYSCLIAHCDSLDWYEKMKQMHLASPKFHHHQKQHRVSASDWTDTQLHDRFNAIPEDNSQQEENISAVLNTTDYFKFAIVCHPWRRLVSAYRDLVVKICNEDRECVTQKYGVPLGRSESPLTLDEFILQMLEMPLQDIARPFLSSSIACNVNEIKYDFIGDRDDKDDMDFILRRIRSPIKELEEESLQSDEISIACSPTTVILASKLYNDDMHNYGCTMNEALETCRDHGVYPAPKK